ncbi:MAG TPA: SAM-dependent methyltransferase [Methylophilaceae bacterium]|jgi:23S rRNA (uridine2552-2'-O)-methyltransferase
MKRTRTSKAWMREHLNDEFVKLANKQGYRSRAAYKLMELDDKDKLIKPGTTVVDLGAAPGSWSQVVVERLQGNGRVIALDMLEMQAMHGVEFIQGDFTESAVLKQLEQSLNGMKIDLVISDMAPNMSGVELVDQARAIHLTELALDFAVQWLQPNGRLLVKTFIGSGFDETVAATRRYFDKVMTRKPKASRDRSSEVYLLGLGRNTQM